MSISEYAQIIQAAGVIIGIIFFLILYNKRNKEIGYETYLRTSEKFIDLERLLIEEPMLRKSYYYGENDDDLSHEDRACYHYFNMLCMLLENVYLCRKKGWLSDDEWDGWDTWIRDLATKSEAFKRHWVKLKSIYSKIFCGYIDDVARNK